MTPPLALDGSGIDGSWYLDVTDFARATPWLNAAASAYSSLGVALFAVLIAIAWWTARKADAAAMTAALAVPAAAVIAYVVNDGLKWAIAERRPCYAYPDAFLLEKCPPATDYSFPSNHTVVVAAMAAALFLVSARLGIIATVAALLMGASRVYVGAHYPHDVVAGIVVGVVVGLATAVVAGRYATALVDKLADSPLRPVFVAERAAVPTAGRPRSAS
ncbi:phosphatase PAP2 family protein [Prescottella agglutinans]|uniref:Membrane-associated phospholipid phosphatase n=1 Tax=Prescottella agglutinans TaxID=1644129 RepID=A0ABT6MF31_9NOCA|nr:phosphatase PAP2 family protein [Prescottella agglutinans]MDH6282931.1 membrane-associated phospholipid phosphatase [Prescottella agglutinans]